MTKITRNSSDIRIDNHSGTWAVVNSGIAGIDQVFMLEHEELGDETNYLIVDENLNVLCDYHDYLSDYIKEVMIQIRFGDANDYEINENVTTTFEDMGWD